MKLHHTERGFARIDFQDANGEQCSIQKSSVATDDLLWLGCDTGRHFQGECMARMHLTRERVAELLPLLAHFVDTGELE